MNYSFVRHFKVEIEFPDGDYFSWNVLTVKEEEFSTELVLNEKWERDL